MPQIDRLFASDRLEDILAALEADGSEWAQKELATLRAKSPPTCKVSLRLLAEGPPRHFADEMRMEYALVGRMVRTPRFRRGRARGADRQGQCAAMGPADARGGRPTR